MIPNAGIPSAADQSVQDVAFSAPSMRSAVQGWARPLILIRVRTTIVDREARQVESEENCMGTVQPFSGAELRMKPEGERSWNWNMLHTTSEIDLRVGERFSIGKVRYRVMGNKRYSDYGYVYYELIEDYANA